MIARNRRIVVTDFEYRLLVKALAEFRDQQLKAKKSTGDITALILKVIDAPKTRRWR